MNDFRYRALSTPDLTFVILLDILLFTETIGRKKTVKNSKGGRPVGYAKHLFLRPEMSADVFLVYFLNRSCKK